MATTDFKGLVKSKYTWLSDDDAQSIVNKAKLFYYNLAYPADMSVDEAMQPISGFRLEQWILSACDEIVERIGFSSSVGYRENGVSWSFDNAQISAFLARQISPVIGTIKEEVIDETA